jgi:hypothetical protein
VFLLTSELLTDTNGDISLFDARVNGGYPEPPTPPPPCNENNCAPPAEAPAFSAPASTTFTGPGNNASSVGGKVGTKKPSRAEKLAKALVACRKAHKHSKKKREACEKAAHKAYGASKTSRAKTPSRKGAR